jgi:L-ascorbate metabolism protein UlaG (beta-lactamase superfamily)
MTTIRRLTDSSLLVSTDDRAVLFDPGFHTFGSGEVDLESIGEVTMVLITHEHGDHAHPEFIRWLIDRRRDLTVHSNEAVALLLAASGIEVSTDVPAGITVEDVLHERVASGATPPNRAFTVDGVLTHPGDSRQPTRTAPVLAVPLMAPWGSITGAVEFASRLRPRIVIGIHDFYLTSDGRKFARNMARGALEAQGIEVADLDWGESLAL